MNSETRTFLMFLVGVTGCGMAVNAWTRTYLRRAHPQVWMKLGAPTFSDRSVRRLVLWLRFIFLDPIRVIADPKLTKLVWASRSLFVLFLVIIAVAKLRGL